ncbi:MAG TPA: hypothetical protein VHO49_11210 [Anaerolineales bacterium]|nr:hypothetical protein [Anaerolineales bacterium]
MKITILLTMLLLTTVSAGCATQGVSGSPVDTTPSGEVQELEGLVEALQAEGAEVELGDAIEQPFLSVPGQIVKVNGADVQVFEYASAEDLGLEASQVSEDGSSIGTSIVSWMAPPHFHRSGRLLVLYVGEDQAIIELLESVVGPQFAGR